MKPISLALVLAAAVGVTGPGQSLLAADPWQPVQGPLTTRWAKDVTPDNVHPEYPRPQMVRKDWLNLNGLWDYAIRGREEQAPSSWDGQILVPFPLESALSGVMKRLGPDQRLWYKRTFTIPKKWSGRKIVVRFGAVDWEAQLFVNGQEIGVHRGGYDPFWFDITKAVKSGADNEIILAVWDPTDASTQPRGKQVAKPESIWYTPTSGIWQTVWIEPVPEKGIWDYRVTADPDSGEVQLHVQVPRDGGLVVLEPRILKAVLLDGSEEVAEGSVDLGEPVTSDVPLTRPIPLKLTIPNPKPWSPQDPFLYKLKLTVIQKPIQGGLLGLLASDKAVDEVKGYVGLRKIELGKDEKGTTRILLNGRPLFQMGPLDQGFWPDGLYTAPSDEALRYDLEVTKQLGFNMVRKHVKVEPDRWYYHCDKLGLLVWQDMPSGDRYIGGNDPDIVRTPESADQFKQEYAGVIRSLYNHPCIVMWVPFNEGWGQFDTAGIAQFTRNLDPTRLVNSASGWTDRKVGDVFDIHAYPGPASPQPEEHRAAVLGEFGGLGLPLVGHTWQSEKNWGYKSFTNPEDLTQAYLGLIGRLRYLIASPGLSAAVYTQTTDVEVEINGLMTYDRALIKIDPKTIAKAHSALWLPPPEVRMLAPTSQALAQTWLHTLESPAEGWQKPDFDDTLWTSAPGGLGTEGTPGTVVRTIWKTPEIWARRSFDLPKDFQAKACHLFIHHDEDAEVYINGVLAVSLQGFTSDYVLVPVSPQAQAALKAGRNILAIHCKQTGGGQYIDVGLADVVDPAEPGP